MEKKFLDSDLLFYCKKMTVHLLANQYTSLNIINSAKIIIYNVISDFDNIFLV